MAEQERCSDSVWGRKQMVMLCQPCGQRNIITVAKLYCKQCEDYQCIDCSKDLGIHKWITGHRIVDVTDAQPGRRPVLDMKDVDMSDEHKGFKYYCGGDEMCCSVCYRTQHRSGKQVKEPFVQTEISTTTIDGGHKLPLKAYAVSADGVNVSKETKPPAGYTLEPLLDENEYMKHAVEQKFDQGKAVVDEKIASTTREMKKDPGDRLSKTEKVAMKEEEIQNLLMSVFEDGSPEQTHITAHVGKKESTSCKTIVEKQPRNIHKPTFSLSR